MTPTAPGGVGVSDLPHIDHENETAGRSLMLEHTFGGWCSSNPNAPSCVSLKRTAASQLLAIAFGISKLVRHHLSPYDGREDVDVVAGSADITLGGKRIGDRLN
jgi:hypothetical protein